jgi:hypothetical protein
MGQGTPSPVSPLAYGIQGRKAYGKSVLNIELQSQMRTRRRLSGNPSCRRPGVYGEFTPREKKTYLDYLILFLLVS